MASLNRIVLVDTLGEELFSGSSMFSKPRPRRTGHANTNLTDREDLDDMEPCPETLRSSVFPTPLAK